MANITLTGCLNPSTGKVDFDLDTPCGVDVTKMFYGCLETTAGVNFGKIKVVTTGNSDDTCDGTYYGCVNWTTGKFSIDVPEECCTEYIAGNNCAYCDAGETPKYIKVTFSGVSSCSGCYNVGGASKMVGAVAVDGSYILEQVAGSNCEWRLSDKFLYDVKKYTSSDCSGTPFQINYTLSDLVVYKHSGGGDVTINFIFATYPIVAISSGCINFTASNSTGNCNYSLNTNGTGGTATVEELWP